MADHSIEAVLFDAAATLLRPEPSVGGVYAAVAGEHGVNISPEALDAAFRNAWRGQRQRDGHHSPFHASEATERAWWRELVRHVLAEAAGPGVFGLGFEGFFNDLYERFAHPDVWHVYDDVEESLGALAHMGLRCAVVSNWDSRLPRLLRELELAPKFAFILTSAEAGYRKPHPAIFKEALLRLGLPPSHVLHVGDSQEEDVAGAHAAGLDAVLLDRQARSTGAGVIRSLRELPDLLSAQGR
jgi:putative hydrolase of the HAD superfamily